MEGRMLDTSIRILLVEDNAGEAVLLRAALAESAHFHFELTQVKRLEAALARLDEPNIDIVLLDLGLPDSQGLGTLERMQRQAGNAPIVVMTGLADEAMALKALQQGAQDYLLKGEIDGRTLVRAIRYAIERKRAEHAFRSAEQWLAVTADAAKIGIWDWNLNSGLVMRSRYHMRLLGLAEGSELGGTFEAFRECVHPDDREAVSAKLQYSIASGIDYVHEFRVIWPDGSEHWLEGRASVSFDDHGKPARLLGTIMDATQRKHDEAAARAREVELAHLSRVGTMGQMASGLAHELNQPLGAILNFSGVVQQQLVNGAGARELMLEAIREVMNETRRAGAIISRLRSFVRKQEPHRTRLDVNEMVSESLRLMNFELRHQNLRPRLNLARNLPNVQADLVQLEQVLVNLIYNALEAMSENAIGRNALRELTLATRFDSQARKIEVAITDTGVGISPETMSRLFQPFNTTKPQGLGMGLNISRSIVESHGGRLTAAANPTGGMRFSFTLPVEAGA
jgi:PAS domain S-box-containing protein